MKYAIIGDIHGEELGDLEKALKHQNPDLLICTADFDQTRSIHQFIDLEKKYQKAGKIVIVVPGNHDHAILNNLGISSGTIRSQGKTSQGLHDELINDPIALKYINELVNSKDPRYTTNRQRIFLDEVKFGKEFQTIIIHGAYDGDLSSSPSCPEEIRDLWMRLRTEDDHKKNFKVMDEKGYKVMIRGHDHEAIYTYRDHVKGIVSYTPKENGSRYRLFKHRKHTINPGALFDGLFATIDTEVPGEKVPILKYHEL